MNDKYSKLKGWLSTHHKIAVAFSGGLDSTFLLAAAKDILGAENVLALTVNSPYIPQWEIAEARDLSQSLGVKHIVAEFGIADEIQDNPEDRCYLCKRSVFKELSGIAHRNGFETLCDGTNADDTKDYRPGMKALAELGVKSPLLECGFTKDDIRQGSKDLELENWNKPPFACLLTRLPYGTRINEPELRRIEMSEKYLMDIGIKAVRVRSHGDLARIESGDVYLDKILNKDLMKQISAKLKEFGYRYVSIDCEGYRTGSFHAAR